MSTNDLSNTGSEETVPVPQAMKMTDNWRTYLASSGQAFNVRSYLIPIISYQNLLLNNPDAEAVRAYIGLTDPADPTTSQLLLVPIVNGREKPYVQTDNMVQGDSGSNVYDLSAPCPPYCGTGGELDG
ncbi:hypothetical protein [Mucilaginibacter sp.]|uniref:hypothetical protein n=1 Tax=Mucilaginibacter sp. TaxID=1882438 RepID=UPI0026318EAB|nr:hypothetical protein [Mucilaginibacter sp.]MDB4926661.1 hypothetical protein [Mucilaginibacter sp.]